MVSCLGRAAEPYAVVERWLELVRVGHLLGWYFPESVGGTEVFVDALARNSARAGHDVLVAAPDASGGSERTYAHRGISVYRFPIPAQCTRDEAQGAVGLRGTQRLHQWLRHTRPDIIHVHGLAPGVGLQEAAVARSIGARTVLTHHLPGLGFVCRRGTLMQWGRQACDGICEPTKCSACVLQSRRLPRPLALALARLPVPISSLAGRRAGRFGTGLGLPALIGQDLKRLRDSWNLFDMHVALNHRAAAILRANGLPDERLLVNRLGTGLSGLARKAGPQERPTTPPVTIGFLGRFDPIKGVDVLIRAARLLGADLSIEIQLCGRVNGADERQYLEYLKRLVGADRRICLGASIPHEEIGETMARYDLLCCPSVSFENGPTVALEAQAVGTPVIGSRIGALPEIVSDGVNGRLFEPGDVAGLAAILSDVARRPSETIDRWRLALPRIRTMDEITADYLSLYDQLLQTPRAAAS